VVTCKAGHRLPASYLDKEERHPIDWFAEERTAFLSSFFE
jgi:hypothetical protein